MGGEAEAVEMLLHHAFGVLDALGDLDFLFAQLSPDKDTVDFVPNYAGNTTEPVILPARRRSSRTRSTSGGRRGGS